MGRPLQRTLAIVATVVVGAFLLFGQGKAAPLSAGPTPALAAMPACADADVIFRLSTSSPVYLPGQPVRITFEVRNAGARWCKVAGQCGEVAPISVFDGHRMLWSDRPCYNPRVGRGEDPAGAGPAGQLPGQLEHPGCRRGPV